MGDRWDKMKRDPRYNGRTRMLNKKRKSKKTKKLSDSRFDEAFQKDSKFNQGKNVKIDRTGKKLEKTKLDQMKEFHGKESDGEETTPKKIIDAARGEVDSDASSSSSEEEIEDIEELSDGEWDQVTQKFYETTKADQHEIEDSTKRLAFVNLDWQKVTVRDIYILANSFKLHGGNVISVKIYKSQAGKTAEKE